MLALLPEISVWMTPTMTPAKAANQRQQSLIIRKCRPRNTSDLTPVNLARVTPDTSLPQPLLLLIYRDVHVCNFLEQLKLHLFSARSCIRY
jgi:hypothetical protein